MRLVQIFPYILLMLLVTACKHVGDQQSLKRTEADAKRKAEASKADSTLFVVLNSYSGDSIWTTNQETRRELSFSITELKKKRKMSGSLTSEEVYALVADLKTKTVYSAINLSELKGLWLLNDGSGNGIRLNEDGAASNIGELDDITLRSWRIKNGQLVFSHIKNDGSDYHEAEETVDITDLSAQKFVFCYHGKQYECSRPQ